MFEDRNTREWILIWAKDIAGLAAMLGLIAAFTVYAVAATPVKMPV